MQLDPPSTLLPTSGRTLPFGDKTRDGLIAGDLSPGLVDALVAMCGSWFELSNAHMQDRALYGAAQAVHAPLLAAALDLYDLLALTPAGRDALRRECCPARWTPLRSEQI